MKKHFLLFIFLFVVVCMHAQTKVDYKKIVVYIPLFLDSAFNNNNLKITNNSISKNILPGLDFYHGVKLAIDSLQKENANLEVIIIDSKNTSETISEILSKPMWDSVSMIIAYFKDRNEIKPLADLSLQKKIPLISATLPNDGGLTNHPYFIVLNPTLQTHCNALYAYIQKKFTKQNIVYVKRNGNAENSIETMFIQAAQTNKTLQPYQFKTVTLSDTFTIKDLQVALDSTKKNIVICGTTQETFGIRLINTLENNKKFLSTAIGMPTWDGIKEWNKLAIADATLKGVEIIYTTPYQFSRAEKLISFITNQYKLQLNGRASDWVFKGYETMLYFSKLLLTYDTSLILHLNKPSFIFNRFNIEANISTNPLSPIQYYENKHLYFIKKQDGVIKVQE